MQRDSIANTFIVSLVLCIVCSLLVSAAAVALKPLQEKNKLVDQQRNIIEVLGLVENPASLSGSQIEELFKTKITPQLVDLSTGEYVTDQPDFDPRKAVKTQDGSTRVEGPYNIGIPYREKMTWVYEVRDDKGNVLEVVLPIYGKGLWSTMYGYVAVNKDIRTIKGLTYYQQGETPGLGGEVENPRWKAQWNGKLIWEEGTPRTDDDIRVGVAKGSPEGERAKYMVDGLSGATITSRGVDQMLKYWFSSEGFAPYLQRLASKEGAADGSPNS